MISAIKLKILVILLIVFIISASTYYYSETKKGSDNSNGERNEITVLEALSMAEEQMNEIYPKYNLSIVDAFWDAPGYADNFVFYFVIDNGSNIIHQAISITFVDSNWTVSIEKPHFTTKPSPHWWFYTDIRGFDPKLVKINSDEAVKIMERVAEKENIKGNLYLRLENNYLLPATPTWFGAYYQSDTSFIIKVNATTGELIDSYYQKTSEKNVYIDDISNTFNGSNFTVLKGLELSNYYMSLKYKKFNVSEIDGITSDGYRNFWKYHYVVVDPIREFVWETITVYANGSLSSETINMEIEEYLTLHGIRDVWGFDVNLLKIDSDEAVNVINSYAKNQSWYNNVTHFQMEFKEEHDYQYYLIEPEWEGNFVANGKIYSFYVNATTGKLIRTTEENVINISTRSSIGIESKANMPNPIGESNLSEVVSIEIPEKSQRRRLLWISCGLQERYLSLLL